MELKFKGTPRPWKQYKRDRLRIYGADGSDVAEVLLDDDAKLIAAAPELLEVCVKLCAFCTEVATMSQTDDKSGAEEVGRKIGNLYGDAYKAIMKALGE